MSRLRLTKSRASHHADDRLFLTNNWENLGGGPDYLYPAFMIKEQYFIFELRPDYQSSLRLSITLTHASAHELARFMLKQFNKFKRNQPQNVAEFSKKVQKFIHQYCEIYNVDYND